MGIPWEGETSHGATSLRSPSLSNGRPGSFTPQVYGVRSAASAYQRRPGSTGSFRKGLQSCEAQPSREGAHKPVAEGGIVALGLSASGSNRGQPGAPGDKRQLKVGLEFMQRGAPVRSAHCFRVSPDPGESWSTAMGSGRRHRQVQLQGGSCKARSRRSRATTQSKGDCWGRARGFFLRFPTPSAAAHPPTDIESTAGGSALVAAA